jgi:4-amino-4-deoxy-L-arabinose transferase-like glycosyltransferase
LPAPLCALLACVAVVGCTWAVVTPPWQAPDETAHVAYVQGLAERGALPAAEGPMMSTEQTAAGQAANAFQVAGVLSTDPEWSPRLAQAFDARDDLARDDGAGANPARVNPPTYYLYETVAYRLAGDGSSIWDRMLAMRLASVLWLLVTVAGAWLLAGQLFRRDRRLQLLAAGFTGLLPMMTFISSSVNPDAMMIALWTLALWLGTATLREQNWRTGLALGLVVGLAVVTKSTSYALVPPALLVLLVAGWRTHARGATAGAVAGTLAALVVLAIPVVAWLALAPAGGPGATAQLSGTTTPAAAASLREFLSFVWQFYLPALPFQSDYEALHPDFQVAADGLPLYATWIRTGWGAFGYLEVQFPDPVYWVLAAASAAVVVGFVVSLRGHLRRCDWATAAFFAMLIGLLLGGLHWTEYHMIAGGGKGFSQGRYLLPLAALGGIAVAQATRIAPAGARVALQGSILGALVVLQLFALALVMARYFA